MDAITLAREHGYVDQNEINDRRKRSTMTEMEAQARETPLNREAREATEANTNGKMSTKMAEESSIREVRNGPYMRFGKKSEIDLDDNIGYDRGYLENEFSRFLRSYGSRISLPRFGKRGDHSIDRKQEYMRFGRGVA